MTAARALAAGARAVAGAMRRILRFAVTSLLCLPVSVIGQDLAALPYQVEAVFLFNFTQFVTWPDDAFAGPNDPLVICMLGEDPFGKYLDETVAGERAQGRPIEVRRYRDPEQADHCHVAFVSRSESSRVDDVLRHFDRQCTLTVSDMEAFGARGGMIRFLIENRRVRLRVNVAAAKAARLTISSKLLRIADIVAERP